MKQKTEYSLFELRALKKIRSFIQGSSKIIDKDFFVVNTNDLPYQLTAFDSSFYFKIDFPKPEVLKNLQNRKIGGKPLFQIDFKPSSEDVIGKATHFTADLREINAYLEGWLKIINEYHNTSLNDEDRFINIYKKEFEEEFRILDPDADTHPFDEKKQLAVYYLLDYVKTSLEFKREELHTELLMQEVAQLQGELQDLTKNETVSRLGKIWGKIRKKGIELSKEVFNEAKKMVIKSILQGGMNEVQTFLHDHISLLQ